MALGLIGGALGVGGALLSGSGKRQRAPGYSAQDEEELRYRASLRSALQGLPDSEEYKQAFTLSEGERDRRTRVFESRQAMTRQEILDQIAAEAAKAGVSGTTRPAVIAAQEFGRLGQNRAEFDIGLDELGVNRAQSGLGFKSQIYGSLLGNTQVGQPYAVPRSQTFGGVVGPALSGVGGQLGGLAALKYALGGSPTATVSRTQGPGYFGMYGNQFPGSVPGGPR